MKRMLKKCKVTAVLLMMILLVGCADRNGNENSTSTQLGEQTTQQENQSKESTTQQNATESTTQTTTEKATEETKKDEIVTTTERSDDGSILMISTNSDGNEVVRIHYDAKKNTTVKKMYEYNKKGKLTYETEYLGPGNLFEEFLADNYEHASESMELNHDAHADYGIDVENAFKVTIEELAPLYKKAEKIKNDYGVVVLIADKVSDYNDGAEKCYDYKQIEACLDITEACLKCYPKDFFKGFSEEDVEKVVCIQLVGTGSTAGAYMGGYDQLLIQIDVNDYTPTDEYDDKGGFLSYTLHHEISHMICATLLNRAEDSKCPLTEEKWNSYNPEGFQYVGYYDDMKEIEIFDIGNNYEYFLMSYGCSTPDEDRAIIFGYAMSSYQGYEVMEYNDKIKAKLKYLSECIKAGFDSESWPEKLPWEYILDK